MKKNNEIDRRSFKPRWTPYLKFAIDLYQEDEIKGLERLIQLSKNGSKSATLMVALYLSESTPTTDIAVHWLLKAAAFNSDQAAWNLAMVFHERNDDGNARKWIDKSCLLGNSNACDIKINNYDIKAFIRTL